MDSGNPIKIEVSLSCVFFFFFSFLFFRQPWAGSYLHQNNPCPKEDSVKDKAQRGLTGPTEDDLRVPLGALKPEASKTIAGHFESSLFLDPTQEPDRPLVDNDCTLDPLHRSF